MNDIERKLVTIAKLALEAMTLEVAPPPRLNRRGKPGSKPRGLLQSGSRLTANAG